MAEAPDLGIHIRPLNKLFFDLGKQLTAGDVDSMKTLLRGTQLQEKDVEKLGTATDVFHCLERKGFIGEDKLSLLIEMFEYIDREPLKEMVNNFLKDANARKKRKARELSIKADVKSYKLQREQSSQTDHSTDTFDYIAKKVYDSVDLRKEGALKEVVDHLKEVGALCKRFKRSSIECVVGCNTMDVLETLWSQYKSGVLQEVFQKAIITDQLLKSLQAEYIIMEVTISEDEYRKCRQEVSVWEAVDKAFEVAIEANKAWDKARKVFNKASKELEKAREERDTEKGKEEKKLWEEKYNKAEEELRKAHERRREAYEEWMKKHEEWVSMAKSADDLEAANIQVQTMKADAEEQTQHLDEEMEMITTQLDIKGDRMKELEAKLPSMSEEEIDQGIQELESKLQSETLSKEDEGKIRAKLDALERSKKIVKEYFELKGTIDSDRVKQKHVGEEREMFHEKAERLRDIEEKVFQGISRMTLKEGEDWRR